ncbi:MAG: YtxH domain-containing protein [Anaerolineales bacterium]|nr:YtxH domain-containing protein [Anaerolineales bacterium]
MRRVINFISGALIGAVVGALFALLFAPSSGETLRSQIQEQVITIQEEVKRASSERRAELEQQLTALRSPQKPGGDVY